MTALPGNLCVQAAAFRSGSVAAKRVLALIPVIWALNLTDLLFTLLAYQTREFVELNPIANHCGPAGQIALKLCTLIFFTAVCVAVRRHRVTELGCYVLTAVYGALAVVWFSAFHFLLSPCYFHLLLGNLSL